MSTTHIVADGELNWAGGTLNVAAGQTLSGSGDFSGVEMVSIANGGTIAPGDSTGTLTGGDLTWGADGFFDVEINDFSGVARRDTLGWDPLMADSISITSTMVNPFEIDLLSPKSGQIAGLAGNFDPLNNYSLLFVSTTGGITGFNASLFNMDASGFQNPFTQSWTVNQSGNDLFLNYSPAVPEPSSFALLGLGAMGLVVARKRRRRAADQSNGST